MSIKYNTGLLIDGIRIEALVGVDGSDEGFPFLWMMDNG